MLRKAAIWLSTLKGNAMKTRMVGDVVLVVIDEIGEVTFFHDPLQPDTVEIGKKETIVRAVAAIVEVLDTVAQLLPTSKSQFYVQGALELVLANFGWFVDRLTEQTEFNSSVRKD